MSWRAKPSVNNSRHSNRANVPSNCRRSTASRNFPAVNPTSNERLQELQIALLDAEDEEEQEH